MFSLGQNTINCTVMIILDPQIWDIPWEIKSNCSNNTIYRFMIKKEKFEHKAFIFMEFFFGQISHKVNIKFIPLLNLSLILSGNGIFFIRVLLPEELSLVIALNSDFATCMRKPQ